MITDKAFLMKTKPFFAFESHYSSERLQLYNKYVQLAFTFMFYAVLLFYKKNVNHLDGLEGKRDLERESFGKM